MFFFQIYLKILEAVFRCSIMLLIRSMLIKWAKLSIPSSASFKNLELIFQTKILKQTQNSSWRIIELFLTIYLLEMMAQPYANSLSIYYFIFILIFIFSTFFLRFWASLSFSYFPFSFYAFFSKASCLYILCFIFFFLKFNASLSLYKYLVSI